MAASNVSRLVYKITVSREAMAVLCSIYACDRALCAQTIDLPVPGSPECDAVFLATWEAFRHVTTELGRQRMVDQGFVRVRALDALEAFVRGREIPAHVRWAETEAMLRAGEWEEPEGAS